MRQAVLFDRKQHRASSLHPRGNRETATTSLNTGDAWGAPFGSGPPLNQRVQMRWRSQRPGPEVDGEPR
jgi:hypothetical protein